MNIIFFACIFFLFLILQTCMPGLSSSFAVIGLDLVPVILVCILYQHYAILMGLAAAGILMDALSGCAFFTHMFSYVWIYVLIQFLKKRVFLKHSLFILLLVLLSIGIESVMTIFPCAMAQGQFVCLETFFHWKQVVWSVGVLLILIWLIETLRKQWLVFAAGFDKNMSQSYKD